MTAARYSRDPRRPMICRDDDGTWIAFKPNGNGFNGNPLASDCFTYGEALAAARWFYDSFPGYTAEHGIRSPRRPNAVHPLGE